MFVDLTAAYDTHRMASRPHVQAIAIGPRFTHGQPHHESHTQSKLNVYHWHWPQMQVTIP